MDRPEASTKATSNALYLTKGYLDRTIVDGGSYSAATDGYAVGITLLVCLTARSPLQLVDRCEEEFEEDFDDIDASSLADPKASAAVRGP